MIKSLTKINFNLSFFCLAGKRNSKDLYTLSVPKNSQINHF